MRSFVLPARPSRRARTPGRSAAARRWRRRGTKGQVAAVATIFGLMIVVTVIANYISTTLPGQMSANDQSHVLQVENQVGRLSALVQAFAARGALGSEIDQPITLGSAGAPPFAPSDGAAITSSVNGAGMSVSYAVSSPIIFAPPLGYGVSHQANLPSGCTGTTSSLTCPAVSSSKSIDWNFSAGDGRAYTVTLGTGGNHVQLNFSTNRSTITISGISGMPIFVQILGSNDTLSLSNNGGGNNPISVNITGSYDTISAGSFPGGASTIKINVIGNDDYINGDPASGGNTMYVSFIGSSDTLALIPGSGSTYHTYFTGFNAFAPTSSYCPYGALAHTDSVTGYTVANGQSANAHLYQTYNNSTADPGNSTHSVSSRWQIVNQTVAPFLCPYTSGVLIPYSSLVKSGFVVGVRNTYAPSAEVAYDEGAVIAAQGGGFPLMVDPPPIAYAGGSLTLVIPQFQGTFGSEAGTGTADVMLRLVSDQTIIAPLGGFTLPSGTNVTISIVTPYAAAWYNYLSTSAAFTGYATCSGPASVCTASYTPGGPLGTVVLTLPVTSLSVTVAVFAVGLS